MPKNKRHPLKPVNPTALDGESLQKVRKALLSSAKVIVKMRSCRQDDFHVPFAANLFRAAMGDESFEALLECDEDDRLSQLLALVRIGGLIAGDSFGQPSSQVCREDASAIVKDLLTLYDTQVKDGPPSWLMPRGKERSTPVEVEHHRRAVVWQRFISTARGSISTGIAEVAERYGVDPRTVRNWMKDHQGDPEMEYRLAHAEGYLKEDTGERIAAIFEDQFTRVVWMKQRNEHHGRGKPGHYLELLAKQADEYRSLIGKDRLSALIQ